MTGVSSPSHSYMDRIGVGPSGDASAALELEAALQQLQWGDFQARWQVAKLFPSFGDAAIAPLLDLLHTIDLDDDDDWELPWFIAQILGSIPHPNVVDVLVHLLTVSASTDVATMAAGGLANLGSRAIAPLTALLEDDKTRLVAVQALAQLQDDDTLAPLLTVVQDPHPAVRVATLEALIRFDHPAVVEAMLRALGDPAAAVRRTAVIGLGLQATRLSNVDAFSPLQPLLYDPNVDVSRQVAIALGRQRSQVATQALGEALLSPYTSATLQHEIIQVLGWMETRSALQVLEQGLGHVSLALGCDIVAALGRIKTPALRPQAAQGLMALLRSPHPLTREPSGKRAIALALGYLGDRSAVAALTPLLDDEDASVRLHA
ncbi:MAG TPA: HEAT repeat domain-containing protein, partial [Chroococcidiopsis sp.]